MEVDGRQAIVKRYEGSRDVKKVCVAFPLSRHSLIDSSSEMGARRQDITKSFVSF